MNQSQRRVAATTLLRLNRTIWEIERRLSLDEVREPMFTAKSELSPIQRRQVKEHVNQIRAAISKLVRAWEFEPETGALFSQAWGELNSHWVSLEDAKSKALKNYGAVDPEDARSWDPSVDSLIRLVNELAHDLRR